LGWRPASALALKSLVGLPRDPERKRERENDDRDQHPVPPGGATDAGEQDDGDVDD